jgi:hypothetical protein
MRRREFISVRERGGVGRSQRVRNGRLAPDETKLSVEMKPNSQPANTA